MVNSVADLVAATRRGERFEYLMFWGHRPAPGGGPGRGCLSQWWPATFAVGGATYRTAEHYMMAEKARLFGDRATAAAIVAAESPREVKELGRRVAGYDDATWTAQRYQVVVRGNAEKFGQNADLRAFLLGTGDAVIVEASPVDAIWGIGLAAEDERATEPAQWPGTNLLGFALMEVREGLRGAEA